MLKEISASRSCAVSLWKEESNMSNMLAILSVEDALKSSRKCLGKELSSEIKEHINFMAKGTCPQICATSMQSAALAFGSNP